MTDPASRLPAPVARAVDRYLDQVDRLLPGVITGFYVVGSTALGAWRPGRSDIDFLAVVDDGRSDDETTIRQLRRQHVRSSVTTASTAVRHGRSPLSGTCNGVFIRARDLPLPVTTITPLASHIGFEFHVGEGGSDVSPVGWKVLAEHGIALRGPAPADLGLDPEPGRLREWNLGNLESYWRPWAEGIQRRVATGLPPSLRYRARWLTEWGVLGPPRLHATIATGEVVSKVAAGEYALDVFPPPWHPLIREALAYAQGERDRLGAPFDERVRLTTAFALLVIDSAHEVAEER